MSDYETVKLTRQGEVGVVSLNRPGSLNAFDAALRRDLLRAVREMNADDGVRVVVLTGEGRSFCAGADLAEVPAEPEHFRVEDQLNGEFKPALLEIVAAPKPWISAVQGPAAGISSAGATSIAGKHDGRIGRRNGNRDRSSFYEQFAGIGQNLNQLVNIGGPGDGRIVIHNITKGLRRPALGQNK